MQITSLTDFPSKLAHVHVIKVSFLLEDRDGGWGASERGEGGARGAVKPFTKIILPRNGVSSRRGGARAESSLADPRSGSCGDSMPATTTRDPRPQLCPQAAPSLQQRRSPCC